MAPVSMILKYGWTTFMFLTFATLRIFYSDKTISVSHFCIGVNHFSNINEKALKYCISWKASSGFPRLTSWWNFQKQFFMHFDLRKTHRQFVFMLDKIIFPFLSVSCGIIGRKGQVFYIIFSKKFLVQPF